MAPHCGIFAVWACMQRRIIVQCWSQSPADWLYSRRQADKKERVFSTAAEHNKPFILGWFGCLEIKKSRNERKVSGITWNCKERIKVFKFRRWLDIVKQKLPVSSPDQQMATELHRLSSCCKFYWKETIYLTKSMLPQLKEDQDGLNTLLKVPLHQFLQRPFNFLWVHCCLSWC